MSRDELQEFINKNISNIEKFELYACYVWIKMKDGTVIDFTATNEGDMLYDKY